MADPDRGASARPHRRLDEQRRRVVERARRLVEEENVGREDEEDAEIASLRLAARQLRPRLRHHARRQADGLDGALERRRRCRRVLLRRRASALRREAAEIREQFERRAAQPGGARLRHIAHARAVGGGALRLWRLAVEEERPRAERRERGEGAKDGRLAAARRSDERDRRARRHLEARVGDEERVAVWAVEDSAAQRE